jgi:diacylglycerol kinase (ATP)
MQDIAIFANPIAGRGKARKIVRSIEMGLEKGGYHPLPFAGAAGGLRDEELAAVGAAKAVVVVGGDGTLRQVVDRLLRGLKRVPPIVVVPMGTANLMGLHLGLQWDERHVGEQVAAAIRLGKRLDLDAASVRESHAEAGQLMLLVAGVGIDAKIVHELSRIRSGPITRLSYALPAAMALGQYRFPVIEVAVDGKKIWKAAGIALVGNVKEYGTGFPVLPHARPDDGLLDVCAMPCTHPGELVQLFLSAAAGEHLEQEGVVYVKGKSIEVRSQVEVEVQVDGEMAGFTPVTIELMKEKVAFLVR